MFVPRFKSYRYTVIYKWRLDLVRMYDRDRKGSDCWIICCWGEFTFGNILRWISKINRLYCIEPICRNFCARRLGRSCTAPKYTERQGERCVESNSGVVFWYESNHLTDVVVTQKLCSRLFSRLFILKLFDTVRKHCFYYLVLRPPCRCFATLGRCASLNVRFFECVKLSNTNGLLAVNLGVKRRAVIGSMPLRRFLLAATPTCLCPVSSSMVISLSNIFTLL